jgi:gluconolactonase
MTMSIYRASDPRFAGLVEPEAGFEVLAEGFRFTEGPVWHPVRRDVTFTDIPSSRIHRWHAADGRTTVLRDPSNMTNGTAYDHDGRLLMCEHATSRVTRLETDGRVTVLADRWRGSELNSPNDIVVDRAGAIWFTDPLYGRDSHTGIPREPGLPFRGVFRIDPDGTLHLIADDFDGPNGLCFSPDGRRLYVNDSERQHVRVYDVGADGAATGGAVFAETRDDDGSLGYGSPDGMKVDGAGNVWTAGQGGIHVFDPAGVLLGVVLTPQFPANFCFGGDDLRDLFVCAGTTFQRLRLRQAGHPVFMPR